MTKTWNKLKEIIKKTPVIPYKPINLYLKPLITPQIC